MCVLIVLNGVDSEYPILVGANRDEYRARRAAPPGLQVGERLRVLAPRDRLAGGTWIGVNEGGMFAGLTNVAGANDVAGRPSRGAIPLLALDQGGVDAAEAAVLERVGAKAHNAFQLLVCDGERGVVLRHVDGEVESVAIGVGAAVIGNEFRLGERELPGVDRALAPQINASARLAVLRDVLVGDGALKIGDERWGTVSSSLIGVPAAGADGLLWRYADGSPDRADYRDYSNLARRLRDG